MHMKDQTMFDKLHLPSGSKKTSEFMKIDTSLYQFYH